MGNWRIILELDREPQDLQAVWRLDSIARLIQQALCSFLYSHAILYSGCPRSARCARSRPNL